MEMSLTPRQRTNKQTSAEEAAPLVSDSDQRKIQSQKVSLSSLSLPSPSISQRAIHQTLASSAQLANLLPTGTLLAFQILTPIFTNNGACDSATRPMMLVLLILLAGSCFLACFTDSFKLPEGEVYYGFATLQGMWLFDYPATASSLPDLSKYWLRFIDGVHAVLSVLVFVSVALKDKNILTCFYPNPPHDTQVVLDKLPIGIGLISAVCCLWLSPPDDMV